MESAEIDYIYIPMMEEFFQSKRKNDALVWIPVPCSLLFRDDFQNLCTATKCIFVAFMLLCGTRGKNEIPFRINYLTRIVGVNKRTMSKGIEELFGAKMLCQRERKKAEQSTEENTQTDTRRETAAAENRVVVCDFSKSSKTESETRSEIPAGFKKLTAVPDDGGKDISSQFTLAECLSYVQLCVGRGDAIKNPHGLATSLFQTGKSDAFIRAAMFPEDQKQTDLEIYGEPVRFSDEPCSVCFGAKMADADGKGYRKCEHCKNEKGKSTGFEPEGEKKND